MFVFSLWACVAQKSATVELAYERYEAGDPRGFVRVLEQVLASGQDGDDIRYNLACGYALTGRPDQALDQLELLVQRRADLEPQSDPDLASLREDPRFVAIVAQLEALFPTVSTSELALEIDAPDLEAEGLAWDGARYFVSSIRASKIVASDLSGQVTDFARLDLDGVPLGVHGLRVDASRGRLWAVARAREEVEGYRPEHAGQAAVFALDLATGERLQTWSAPGQAPELADLVVTADGDVLASGHGLWWIESGADALVPAPTSRPLGWTNGITLGPDDHTVYVTDVDGLYRVDLGTWAVTSVPGPEGVPLGAFDGLVYAEGSLFGIQRYDRRKAVQLVLDGDRVAEVRLLEQNTPHLLGASNCVVVGDEVHYLAARAQPEGLQPVVMRLPIPNES